MKALVVNRDVRVEVGALSRTRLNNPLGFSYVIRYSCTSLQKGIQILFADRAQFLIPGSNHFSYIVFYRIELLIGDWHLTRNSIGFVVPSEIFELPFSLGYLSYIVRDCFEFFWYSKVSCLHWNDVGQHLVVLYVLVDSEHMGKLE